MDLAKNYRPELFFVHQKGSMYLTILGCPLLGTKMKQIAMLIFDSGA